MAERKRPALNGPTIETAPSNRRRPKSAAGARRRIPIRACLSPAARSRAPPETTPPSAGTSKVRASVGERSTSISCSRILESPVRLSNSSENAVLASARRASRPTNKSFADSVSPGILSVPLTPKFSEMEDQLSLASRSTVHLLLARSAEIDPWTPTRRSQAGRCRHAPGGGTTAGASPGARPRACPPKSPSMKIRLLPSRGHHHNTAVLRSRRSTSSGTLRGWSRSRASTAAIYGCGRRSTSHDFASFFALTA